MILEALLTYLHTWCKIVVAFDVLEGVFRNQENDGMENGSEGL